MQNVLGVKEKLFEIMSKIIYFDDNVVDVFSSAKIRHSLSRVSTARSFKPAITTKKSVQHNFFLHFVYSARQLQFEAVYFSFHVA